MSIGPKIFLVPIRTRNLETDAFDVCLPAGFAFAGETLTGQFIHSLATTTLQNLAAPQNTVRPSIEEVAQFFGKCAENIVANRWRHLVSDYSIHGLVFGYCEKIRRSRIFSIMVTSASDEVIETKVDEIDLRRERIYCIGSGAKNARAIVDELRRAHQPIWPIKVMDKIIADPSVPSVGGAIQASTASPKGVALKPMLRRVGSTAGEYTVMGVNIFELGMVGGYVPVAQLHMVDDNDPDFAPVR
ncbi:hypothetical protein E9232_006324 [Inquilinus ginsengisoli]|uniref:Uncharacterized protein n=1 Tax=Inquilinus ginsengisoli TaxID=363840 RepID=A0ABU1JYT0_9PROT|nr:hypothetical protein [Inquilinus ginsengisoli]MDR6293771.1 hypothetical protein [Inquilinus ginsengisoli]